MQARVIVRHGDPAKRAKRAPPSLDTSVYILELAHGRVYVGKSAHPAARIHQHFTKIGASVTRAFPPTGRRLPRLGNVSGAGDAAERDETLRYMHLRGIGNVRGWRYTAETLSPADYLDAERNIRELFDLCRRCGRRGHFAAECPVKAG